MLNNSFARGHNFLRQFSLPSKDDTLSYTKSKVRLIEQISAGLVNIGVTEKNRLLITWNYHCATEPKNGKKALHSAAGTGHEDFDNTIYNKLAT